MNGFIKSYLVVSVAVNILLLCMPSTDTKLKQENLELQSKFKSLIESNESKKLRVETITNENDKLREEISTNKWHSDLIDCKSELSATRSALDRKNYDEVNK